MWIPTECIESVVLSLQRNDGILLIAVSYTHLDVYKRQLINSGVMLDAIYREGTFVSVEDTPRTDSPLTNLQLAKVHEYGTKDKHIPARPVWRDSFAAFKPVARKRIEQFFKKHGSKR